MIKKIEDLNYYELLEIGPTASTQEIHKAYERARRVYEPNSVALYSLFSSDEIEAIRQRIEEAYRTLLYEDNRKKYDALLREREELPELPELPEPPAPPMRAYERRPAPTMRGPVQTTLPLLAEDRDISLPEPQLAPASPQPAPASPQPAQNASQPVPPFTGEFTGPAIKAFREQRGQSLHAIADLTKVSVRYLEYIELEAFQKLPVRTYLRGFLMLYAKALGCDPERMSMDYLKRYEAAMKPTAKK